MFMTFKKEACRQNFDMDVYSLRNDSEKKYKGQVNALV